MDGGSAEVAGRADAPATGFSTRDARGHEGTAERGCMAAEEARRVAKLPKPMFQKFTEKDDHVESYLNMFERVAAQQEWPKETWAMQLTSLLLVRCPRRLLLSCSCECQGAVF